MIRYALKRNVDYVWLLNNDTVVDTGALRPLVDEATSDSSVGMVGSKIYYYLPPDVIWFGGGTIDMSTGKTLHDHWQERDVGQSEEPRDVGYVTGCSVLVPRQLMEDVGLMDTRFFLYYEETDWETRAKRCGWRIRYQPKSKVWHKVSSSSGLNSPTQVFHFAKSGMLFAKKHISDRSLLPLLAAMRHEVLPFLVRGKLVTAVAGIRGARAGMNDE